MIRQDIGMVGKTRLFYHQIETDEDAKKHNIPQGIFFWWETDKGDRIFSPFQIISMVHKSIEQGTFEAEKLITEKGIKSYHKALYEAQKTAALDALESVKDSYVENNMPKDVIGIIERTISDFQENYNFADEMGMFKPSTVKHAEEIAGKNLSGAYAEDVKVEDVLERR